MNKSVRLFSLVAVLVLLMSAVGRQVQNPREPYPFRSWQ